MVQEQKPKRQKPKTEHYFSPHPQSQHRESTIRTLIRGKQYTFITDSSVFSKDEIDRGTRLLIESIEIGQTDDVLDLGCGYGAIGIVAATLASKGRSYLVDSNERAAALARRNIELNKITNAEVRLGNALEPFGNQLFDVILTNPPIRAGRETTLSFIRGAYQHLRPNGLFYLVIQTQLGAKTINKKMEEVFSNSRYLSIHGGYRVILSKRLRSDGNLTNKKIPE